jgi:hypothetical protein
MNRDERHKAVRPSTNKHHAGRLSELRAVPTQCAALRLQSSYKFQISTAYDENQTQDLHIEATFSGIELPNLNNSGN